MISVCSTHSNPESPIFNSLVLLLAALSSACSRPANPPQPYLAFVANSRSDTVAVVNLAAFRVVASIRVAPNPERIVVRPLSRELWVLGGPEVGKGADAAPPSDVISVIRFPQLDVRKQVRVGRSARSLVFSADGRQAYVFDGARGQVVFLESDDARETARVRLRAPLKNPSHTSLPAPRAAQVKALGQRPLLSLQSGELALTPDGKLLVISGGSLSNQLHFVSVDSRKLLGSVEVGIDPGPMVVLPDSSKVFVADTAEPKISVVDVAARKLLTHIETGVAPSALLLKPDGGEIFALSARQATLTIVDAFHDNMEQNLTTGREPWALAIRRDSSVLYVSTAGDGTVTAIDVQNRAVIAATHAGIELRALALTPDERFLVAADYGTASLAVLRTRTGKDQRTEGLALVTTIPVGAGPVDVVIPDWL